MQPQPTGRIRWHNLQMRFSGDGDLDRFERLLEELLGARVARDLLRLEVSGSSAWRAIAAISSGSTTCRAGSCVCG